MRSRVFFSLLVCLLAAPSVLADDPPVAAEVDPKRLSTEPELLVGQYFVYTYTKTKTQTGRPQEVGTTEVRLEVLGNDEDSWHVSWHQVVPQPDEADQSVMARLSRAGDMTLQLRVHKDFGGIDVANFEEIHPRLVHIAELTFELVEDRTPPDQREQTRQAVVGMFEDPAFALATVVKPVQLFFLPAGWEGVAGNTRVTETELANPFNGPALPATLTVLLRQIEDNPGFIKLDYTQSFAPERVEGLVKEFMQSLGRQFGLAHLDEVPAFEMDLRDRAIAEFEVEQSIFHRIEFHRSITMEIPDQPKTQRLESWIWLLTASGVKQSLPDEP